MPLSHRYPDLALHLQMTPYKPFELIQQENQFWNGKREKAWLYEGEDEIFNWKSTLVLEQTDLIYIYGLGLGHYYFALKEWLEKDPSHQLVFLEEDLAIFAIFSTCPSSFHEIIDHPQVHFKWIYPKESLDLILEELAQQFPIEKVEVTALKCYEKSVRFKKIRLALLRKTVLWQAYAAEKLSGHLLHENIIPNLRKIPGCFYSNRWKDRMKGVPIIICGAGPSLNELAPELNQLRDRALIVGCGSALAVLSHLRVRPHLGIVIDPNEREFDALKECRYDSLPLLFSSRLYRRVFEIFTGPYGYIRSGIGTPFEHYVEERLGLVDPLLGYDLGREALSVTTLMVSLATDWGCDPIILAGVDLAYFKGRYYAEGVPCLPPFESKERRVGDQIFRCKGKKKTVLTLTKWIMERDTLDNYAQNHPEKTFLNTGEKGVAFRHIRHLSLNRIKDQYLQKILKLDEKIERLTSEEKLKASGEAIENIFIPLKESLENSLSLLVLLEKEESLGKSILFQSELEAELAYSLFLQPITNHIGRIAQLENQTNLSREKWKTLKIVCDSYLKTFIPK